MPVEIVATVVGVVLTGLIGLSVYQYRAIITYDIISLHHRLIAVDQEIQISNDYQGSEFYFERISMENRGLTDVANFVAHFERTPEMILSQIKSTNTLSKNAIRVASVNDHLSVEMDTFPRSEKVVLELVYKGMGVILEYRDARGGGGKYRLEKKNLFEAKRRGVISGIIWGLATLVLATIFIGMTR